MKLDAEAVNLPNHFAPAVIASLAWRPLQRHRADLSALQVSERRGEPLRRMVRPVMPVHGEQHGALKVGNQNASGHHQISTETVKDANPGDSAWLWSGTAW